MGCRTIRVAGRYGKAQQLPGRDDLVADGREAGRLVGRYPAESRSGEGDVAADTVVIDQGIT